MSRTGERTRETNETKVRVRVDLDGTGRSSVTTGIGFLDHLLTSLAHHALLDLEIETAGDIEVDDHHTVEDTALVLGEALAEALGDRTGVARFGNARVPMDEAIAECALDIGGRAYSVVDLELSTPYIGNLTTQNIPHAIETLATRARFTLHLSATGRKRPPCR